MSVARPFRLGNRRVKPSTNEIDGVRVDAKAMDVLVCIAGAAPEVVSTREILDRVWSGVVVGDNVLHQAITHLRKALGDDARTPRYIESIPRRGYRLRVAVRAEGTNEAQDAGIEAARGVTLPGGRWAEPLLAVLPFDNLSADAGLRYFSDGVSEEILQTLARTTRLRVIGRTSSFQFRGADKVVRKVAEELKATHVLDGSVRRSGQRVRISAQLIECRDQTTIWSHEFEHGLFDIFALQDEVARAVAHALRLAFSPSFHLAPIDPIAFDLYLRAIAGPTTYVGAHDADLLEAAVAREPLLAPAWATLALSRALEAQDAGMATGPLSQSVVADLRRRAKEAAARALALDPNAALAHSALAALEPICGAFAQSRSHLSRALAAAPDDPTALLRMSRWSRSTGLLREALTFAGRAYEIDPLNPSAANDHATMLYFGGVPARRTPFSTRIGSAGLESATSLSTRSTTRPSAPSGNASTACSRTFTRGGRTPRSCGTTFPTSMAFAIARWRGAKSNWPGSGASCPRPGP
jgi:adenylate cyclase